MVFAESARLNIQIVGNKVSYKGEQCLIGLQPFLNNKNGYLAVDHCHLTKLQFSVVLHDQI